LGCISTTSVTITATPAIIVSNPVTIPPSVCGACDGSIMIQPSGGTPNYTFNWSNGSTNDTLTALCAGTYSVIISDAGGCSDTGACNYRYCNKYFV
jgi:hypothetical protein